MQSSDQLTNGVQAELVRRHKAAALMVRAFLVLTVVLCLVAFTARNYFPQKDNPLLEGALRFAILILGLGSVILRRTRLSAMRLHDVAALKGVSGLLETLANTTLQLAVLGGALALLGFVATAMTGNAFYAYGAGLVGFVVLLYGYPIRSSWERTVQKFAPKASEPAARSVFKIDE